VSEELHAAAALPLGKDILLPIQQALGGHGWSGQFRENKNVFPIRESNHDVSVVRPRNVVIMLNELSRNMFIKCKKISKGQHRGALTNICISCS
jgi:hypothetical protein